MLKETIKSIFKKADFRLTTNYFGIEQWDDTVTLLGRHPDIVFDVGANIGQTVTTLVGHFPQARIHCFEPFPKSFAALQKVVASYPNVVAHNMGMGAEDSRQSLFVHPGSEWNSMLKVSEDIHRLPNSNNWTFSSAPSPIDVEIATVDGYCRDNKIDHIDVLKIDTQGYELSVLKGAREMLGSKRIRLVFMEMNLVAMYDGQASFEDLYHHMKESGYKLSGLYDRCFDNDRAIMWCDGLFVA
jgi:FkbM family methyltransferase